MFKKLNEELLKLLEYKIEGTIVQEDGGKFNIVDEKKQPMLNKSYASLKQMLLDLANNL